MDDKDVVKFGQYKGKMWQEVPSSYLAWLVEKKFAIQRAQAELTRRGYEHIVCPNCEYVIYPKDHP